MNVILAAIGCILLAVVLVNVYMVFLVMIVHGLNLPLGEGSSIPLVICWALSIVTVFFVVRNWPKDGPVKKKGSSDPDPAPDNETNREADNSADPANP